jgi:hypothetical protein
MPDLYRFDGFDVQVVLEPGPQYGRTIAATNNNSHIKVCTGVDYERFLNSYVECLLDGAGEEAHAGS